FYFYLSNILIEVTILLLKLSPMGKLYTRTASITATVLSLETDLYGNYRYVIYLILSHYNLSCVNCVVGRSGVPGGGSHVLAWLGDGGCGGDFSVHPWIPAGRAFDEEAVADSGGSKPCGRCYCIKCSHHSDLNYTSLLLCHCAFCQVCHVGLHGPCQFQQTTRRCGEGQPSGDTDACLPTGPENPRFSALPLNKRQA
uniref:Uncharacterized protein n=1 Tax=Periophthalmus magnuspinnatus TaxID=409849 RepID=A0A3B4ADS2_9GOBI